MKTQYAIRVNIPDEEAFDPNETIVAKLHTVTCNSGVSALIESLRYAGILRTHESDNGLCFDLIAPKSIGDTKMWSEQNARRMATFGFQARSVEL